MSPEYEARVAKAKATRAANKALKSEAVTEMASPTVGCVSQIVQSDRDLFVEGLKLGISNLDIRSPNELQRAIPFASDFVKIVKEKS